MVFFCARKIFALNAEINAALNSEEISAALEKSELLKPTWQAFEKTLIQTNGETYSTIDAAEFFSPPNFTRNMNMTFWQGYGGIFTGLGILGTFGGLTFGLNGVDMTSGDIEMLKEGIEAEDRQRNFFAHERTNVDDAERIARGFTAARRGIRRRQ